MSKDLYESELACFSIRTGQIAQSMTAEEILYNIRLIPEEGEQYVIDFKWKVTEIEPHRRASNR
jgi:hypothetical protein